ncbi:phosphate ABC transporter permease subunit PstC [Paraglaciecola polaris]|uniref:Phosphate transport system permease protein n=1 Tax=Paraglaciecola polaris LMG 21857 TaxID=1129793 RepID=K7A276_9ALTE|nr:phosphate ABC transporter permease subunit PstC [Paraglaciecola polaris]GAC35043.1 phosphate transport system permease protein [Paraglaciecola polaris LMG 21857]|tara:strand:- start:6237 stop:7631 length:1395 start_codon:yes stop_codon:yes gene_type:complete
METPTLIIITLLCAAGAYILGRNRAANIAYRAGKKNALHSLPYYYGVLSALWCALPCLLIVLGWSVFDDVVVHAAIVNLLPESAQALPDSEIELMVNTVINLALYPNALISSNPPDYLVQAGRDYLRWQHLSQLSLSVVVLFSLGLAFSLSWLWIKPKVPARQQVERVFKWALLLCASIAIVTTVGIVLSVLFESLRFFQSVNVFDFIFGTHWSPQTALRIDQVGASGAFGAVPLFLGTLLISFIAMLVAVPAGLMSAIYLSEYASPRLRAAVKPMLEILAGIPSVVYGFFAALTVAPFIRDSGGMLGLDVSSESALAAGLVMGVMIIPFVSSLSDDVLKAVPQSLRDGSLGLGATQSETIKLVVIPAALPGIVSGVLLAASRAIGETMIVVMAAGLAAHLTANPLESVTTITVQIVTLLVGDQEFDSPKTLSAFALGLMLFSVTLVLNYIALYVVRQYREEYE